MGFKSEDIIKQPTEKKSDAESTVNPEETNADTSGASDTALGQQKATQEIFDQGLKSDSDSETADAQGTAGTKVVSSPVSAGANTIPSPETGTQGVSFTKQQEDAAKTIVPGQGVQLIDWSKPYSEIEQNDQLRKMTPYDILQDFQKNGDGNYATFMPWLSKYDPNKTVEQGESEAEKAMRQAKWEQWGNLFQHLGNFFGTTIGAPAQQIESATDLTERQRKLREGIESLRQKNYGDLLTGIYKERAAKQSQMQAEANAKAAQARADYYGSQKNQVDALTPEKVKTEQSKQGASDASAALSTARKKTEDALRGKKGELLTAQANNANSSAADHAAGVLVKGAQVKHINSQTEGQNQKNAAQKEADDFNNQYVNNPQFKKYVNQWASHNGMAIGGNDGTGGTWANEKNRQQASKWAKAQMKRDHTPPSRRAGVGSSNKVPPSRRQGSGNSKIPPSRRK